MQTILVLPFDKADYVHNEEVVQIRHLSSKAEYEVLVKDLDSMDATDGRVGILIPLDSLDDLVLEGGYLSIVISGKERKEIGNQLDTLGQVLQALRSGAKVSIQ